MDVMLDRRLTRIEEKLDDLIKNSENRITAAETTLKKTENDCTKCVNTAECKTMTKSLKVNIGFIYSLIVVVFSALIYSFTGTK